MGRYFALTSHLNNIFSPSSFADRFRVIVTSGLYQIGSGLTRKMSDESSTLLPDTALPRAQRSLAEEAAAPDHKVLCGAGFRCSE